MGTTSPQSVDDTSPFDFESSRKRPVSRPCTSLLEKKTKKRRWVEKKSPPRKWSIEEDKLLSAAVAKYGAKNWKQISQFVPQRNHTQCLQRWAKVLAPDLRKGPWTPDEDTNLVAAVMGLEQKGEGVVKDWADVADQIKGRTTKQCRERWFNHLDPSIKRGNFSEAEDTLILEQQTSIGNRWSVIASLLEGRTEDAVKIRWKALNRMRTGGKSKPVVKGTSAEKASQKENTRPQIKPPVERLECKPRIRNRSLGRLFDSAVTPLSPLPPSIASHRKLCQDPAISNVLALPDLFLQDFDLCSGPLQTEKFDMRVSSCSFDANALQLEVDTEWLADLNTDVALHEGDEELLNKIWC